MARTDDERRTILTAIGPVWNGNEVWLIVAGTGLFLAFPRAYAAGFSGFYLALIMVLWLFMGRGLAISWAHMWIVCCGDNSGTSSSPLQVPYLPWQPHPRRTFKPRRLFFLSPSGRPWCQALDPGIIDWFTLLLALISAVALTAHGANILAMKTTGDLQDRIRRIARLNTYGTVVLLLLMLAALSVVQPSFRRNYDTYPIGYALPLMGLAALVALLVCRAKDRDVPAFASSSMFLLSLLAAVACGAYPNLLIATTDASLSLTTHNASAGKSGLQAAFSWITGGVLAAISYQVAIHGLFRGPVKA